MTAVFQQVPFVLLRGSGRGHAGRLDRADEERPSPQKLEEESLFSYTLPDLDLDYLMKSAQAISAEVEQDALMKKIMHVVIESSGAQHGYLLIEEEGELFIRAESHVADKEAARTFNQKLEEGGEICKAIVRYVYRTGERVILSNAAQEGIFKDNPEVQILQLHSVLCLPVIKKSRLIGMLYLENRLSDGVFTAEKAGMTELLMLQAAIALENARLVAEMRKKEEWVKRMLKKQGDPVEGFTIHQLDA